MDFKLFIKKKFDLPFLSEFVKEGTDIRISVSDYFSNMLDQNMNWDDAIEIKKDGMEYFV